MLKHNKNYNNYLTAFLSVMLFVTFFSIHILSHSITNYGCDLSNQGLTNNNVANKILACSNKTSIDLSGNELTSLSGVADQSFTSSITKIDLSNNIITDFNYSYNFIGISQVSNFIIHPQRADTSTIKTTPNTTFDTPSVDADNYTFQNNQFSKTAKQLATSYGKTYGGGDIAFVSQGKWKYLPENTFNEGGYKEGRIEYNENISIPYNKYELSPTIQDSYLPFTYRVEDVQSDLTKYQVKIENETSNSYVTQEYALIVAKDKQSCKTEDLQYKTKQNFNATNFAQFNIDDKSNEQLCVKRTYTQPNQPFLNPQDLPNTQTTSTKSGIYGSSWLSLTNNKQSPLTSFSLSLQNDYRHSIPAYTKSLFILTNHNSPLDVTLAGKQTVFSDTDSQTDIKRTINIDNLTLTDQANFPIPNKIYFMGNYTSAPIITCSFVECKKENAYIQISNATAFAKIKFQADNYYQQITINIQINYVKPPSLSFYNAKDLECQNTKGVDFKDIQDNCYIDANTNDVSKFIVTEPPTFNCFLQDTKKNKTENMPKGVSTLTKTPQKDGSNISHYEIDTVKWFNKVGNTCKGVASFNIDFKSSRTYNGQELEKTASQHFDLLVYHNDNVIIYNDKEIKKKFHIKKYKSKIALKDTRLKNKKIRIKTKKKTIKIKFNKYGKATITKKQLRTLKKKNKIKKNKKITLKIIYNKKTIKAIKFKYKW